MLLGHHYNATFSQIQPTVSASAQPATSVTSAPSAQARTSSPVRPKQQRLAPPPVVPRPPSRSGMPLQQQAAPTSQPAGPLPVGTSFHARQYEQWSSQAASSRSIANEHSPTVDPGALFAPPQDQNYTRPYPQLPVRSPQATAAPSPLPRAFDPSQLNNLPTPYYHPETPRSPRSPPPHSHVLVARRF